jgi:hypothetical protein
VNVEEELPRKRKFNWKLPPAEWAWLHFKISLGFMLVIPMASSPTLQQSTTWVFLLVWVIFIAIGTAASAIGLFLGNQYDVEQKRRGYRFEMTGLILMLAGPLVFMLVQLGLWVQDGGNKALAIAFPYVVIAALVARMAMLRAKASQGTVIVRYLSRDEIAAGAKDARDDD